MEKTFLKKVCDIQQKLKVEKTRQSIEFNFNYRTAEDIIKAVKPDLNKANILLTTPSRVYEVGNKPYVEVTAVLTDVETGETLSASAAVGIQTNTAGRNICQDSGAATSYAKKYALGNLFALDDGIDVDNANDGLIPAAAPTVEEEKTAKNPLTDPVMSLEDAFQVKVDMGSAAGHTLKEVYDRQKQNLFWLIKMKSATSAACWIIINNDPELKAMCERKSQAEQTTE